MLKAELNTRLNTFSLDVKFAAEAGKTTVLLGESGAGKSTVLRLLSGLIHPQHGYISLNGVTYFDSEQRIAIPPQERATGYVFQDYALFPHLNVFENVAFGLRAQHMSRSIIRQRVGEALEQVHLAGFDRRLPAQLSGGQQQRVAIARVLTLRPELLLLDEPLSALDVQTRREVRQELRSILSNVSITTVMVTHQYVEALLFGNSILVLDHGHIIQQGSQRDLVEQPRSSYVAELVGVNFFRGRVVRCETNSLCTIQIAQDGQDGQPVEVTAMFDHTPATTNEPYIGEDAYVIVEPQSITLYHVPPDSSARNVFRGTITQLLRSGSSIHSGSQYDGSVRVSILVGRKILLTAEITGASAARMELSEGKTIYAAFKATEAKAYI